MNKKILQEIFLEFLQHRSDHKCGAYPYEQPEILIEAIKKIKAKRILEVGTGLGYAALCMALSDKSVHIDTIDQDQLHITLAKESWERLGVVNSMIQFNGKAEIFLPTLLPFYDIIFFDGYVPQRKFFIEFERLLKKGGILITANLFLRDKNGGMFLKKLKDSQKWETSISQDTAISKKLY